MRPLPTRRFKWSRPLLRAMEAVPIVPAERMTLALPTSSSLMVLVALSLILRALTLLLLRLRRQLVASIYERMYLQGVASSVLNSDDLCVEKNREILIVSIHAVDDTQSGTVCTLGELIRCWSIELCRDGHETEL
jgi:hypothetical protein